LVLDKNGYIKLIDLGLAKDGLQDESTTSTFCGTPQYLGKKL
jgi:serine/threonine protein kinase